MREVTPGRVRSREDRITTEEPLEIRLAWPGHGVERVGVTMRTPGYDFELAAGFLRAEGIVATAPDIHTVAYCRDHTLRPEERYNVVTVELAVPPRRTPTRRYGGPGAGSAACGVCGKESIADVLAVLPASAARPTGDAALVVDPQVVLGLPDTLREAQRVFDSTGGLHAAGLFTADGDAVVVREDVGRHNAVDKVFGAGLLGHVSADAPLLCVSGRIGFELVQKAVVAGVAVIAGVGAPSSLAVDLAGQAGLCVAGFVRGERFVVYTVPHRLGV